MKSIKDNFIISTLPSSLSKDKNFQAFSTLSDAALQEIIPHVDDGILLASIDVLASNVLDHMAAQWRAKVWRDSWPVDVKRQVLKALIKDKSRQGTLAAVKSAVSSIGSAAFIKEWWQMQPEGKPHTFNITIDQTELEGIASEDLLLDLKRLVDDAKPVRSQYTFTIMQKAFVNVYRFNALRAVSYARINTNLVSDIQAYSHIARFNAVRNFTFTKIQASKHYSNTYKATISTLQSQKGRAVVFKRI